MIDDEYALSVYREPQLAITTCRNASSRIVQFMKELALVFPNTTRLNRGALVVKDLVQSCI
jgi:U3 small nucleolar ribonucleoprotein protein IMP4